MPPRDEQDYETRRQQIISAALNVFAHKGFERATNKDIAGAAGIRSPGLIYHYFKDKNDLFRCVVEERAPAMQFVVQGDDLLAMPPREFLTRFATALMQTFTDRAAMSAFRLMLAEAVHNPAVAELFNRVGPGRGLLLLSRYMQHQMAEGRLRKMDAGAAARCFVGPLLAYMLTREVFLQPDTATLEPSTMIESAVDVFLIGMQTGSDECP